MLDGDPAPLPKKGAESPISGPCLLRPNGCIIKMPLGMEVGLGPEDIVLDGDAAPLSKKGPEPPPQFSIHVYCGQRAAWIKMALGMEVGLGPGHTVLDGDPASVPKKEAKHLNFRPMRPTA